MHKERLGDAGRGRAGVGGAERNTTAKDAEVDVTAWNGSWEMAGDRWGVRSEGDSGNLDSVRIWVVSLILWSSEAIGYVTQVSRITFTSNYMEVRFVLGINFIKELDKVSPETTPKSNGQLPSPAAPGAAAAAGLALRCRRTQPSSLPAETALTARRAFSRRRRTAPRRAAWAWEPKFLRQAEPSRRVASARPHSGSRPPGALRASYPGKRRCHTVGRE
ncbi:Protein of unknown function [Gryllus bimaculatus]|nr:Protein of unknown function [Gryllus bimaculatus]